MVSCSDSFIIIHIISPQALVGILHPSAIYTDPRKAAQAGVNLLRLLLGKERKRLMGILDAYTVLFHGNLVRSVIGLAARPPDTSFE